MKKLLKDASGWCMIIVLAAMFTIGCTSARILTPVRDEAMITYDSIGQAMAHNIYQAMTTASDKSYSAFEADYKSQEIYIDSLIAMNQRRPKAGKIATQWQLLKSTWLTYEATHQRKGKLNNSEIRVNDKYIHDFYEAIKVSDKSLKNPKK